MLITDTLFDGVQDKVQIAIARLREFEPEEGYYLAFSGGKDSVVVFRLAEMARVKFDAHQNLTSVDPPELLRFVRSEFPSVKLHKPEKTMRQLIIENKYPPTRTARYCCAELKERGGAGRVVLTGIRWAESTKRAGRKMVEFCLKDHGKRLVHPIIDWSDSDVWDFIKGRDIPYCHLYDEGQRRIGCVGCPMDNQRRQFARWPGIGEYYRRSMVECYEKATAEGHEFKTWRSGDEMFNWWISNRDKRADPDQTVMFE